MLFPSNMYFTPLFDKRKRPRKWKYKRTISGVIIFGYLIFVKKIKPLNKVSSIWDMIKLSTNSSLPLSNLAQINIKILFHHSLF